jgi:hypothetical protein
VLQRMAQGHLDGHPPVLVLGHNLFEGVGSHWGASFLLIRIYVARICEHCIILF